MTSMSETVGPTITSTIRPSIGFPSVGDPILAPDHPNLLAMYTMDNISGATLVDETANSQDGTITGATAVAGLIGNALHFDASSEKVDSGQQLFDKGTSEDFSLSIWVKTTDATKNKAVIQKRGGVIPYNGYSLVIFTAGNLDFLLQNDTATNTLRVQSTETVNDGSWHHICAVASRSTSTVILYLDGVEVNTTTSASMDGKTISTTASYVLGNKSNPEQPSSSFTDYIGDLDQHRHFDRIITQPEVTALYNEGAP